MKIEASELKDYIINGSHFLDVRAPIEFADGHIPGAANIPLLENNERHEVGTIYKTEGKDAAISLGHEFVQGKIKEERLEKWLVFFKNNPRALLYCFRGGLRSQTVQAWLKSEGVEVPLLSGGYKAARQYFISYLDEAPSQTDMLLISGPTGSGKTHLIQALQSFSSAVDLEGLAHHRGSAFGFESRPQPAQAQFENKLAAEILKVLKRFGPEKPLILEDESRLIGLRALPEKFFLKMRDSQILWVDEPIEQRVENIFADYITNTAIGQGKGEEALALFERYDKSLENISKRLGGLKTKEIAFDLTMARQAYINRKNLEPNKVWIEKLLIHYYDPLYLGSLEKRSPRVCFRGTRRDSLDYLKTRFCAE